MEKGHPIATYKVADMYRNGYYVEKDQEKYIDDVFESYMANREAVDELIGKFSSGWKISRMDKTDLAALRVAVTELKFLSGSDVPEKAAINEAVRCRETGEKKTIVFGLTGTGYFDMVAYEKYHDGKMDDYIPSDEELRKYIAKLPKID